MPLVMAVLKMRLIIVLFLSLLFSVPLFLSSIFIFFSYYSFENNTSVQQLYQYQYQYQEIRASSNEPRISTITLEKKLSSDEFISYRNLHRRSTVIISNFADSQFECSGSCTCTSNERRIISLPSRSLFLLISASSSSIALKMAEKSFRDQCEFAISQECDDSHSNVTPEVHSCSEKDQEDLEDVFVHFNCEGYCIPKIFRIPSTYQHLVDYERDNGKCESLRLSGISSIPLHIGLSHDRKFRTIYMNQKAKEAFSASLLTPFCRDNSKYDIFYRRPNGKSGYSLERSMCKGTLDNAYSAKMKRKYKTKRKDSEYNRLGNISCKRIKDEK